MPVGGPTRRPVAVLHPPGGDGAPGTRRSPSAVAALALLDDRPYLLAVSPLERRSVALLVARPAAEPRIVAAQAATGRAWAGLSVGPQPTSPSLVCAANGEDQEAEHGFHEGRGRLEPVSVVHELVGGWSRATRVGRCG